MTEVYIRRNCSKPEPVEDDWGIWQCPDCKVTGLTKDVASMHGKVEEWVPVDKITGVREWRAS